MPTVGISNTAQVDWNANSITSRAKVSDNFFTLITFNAQPGLARRIFISEIFYSYLGRVFSLSLLNLHLKEFKVLFSSSEVEQCKEQSHIKDIYIP